MLSLEITCRELYEQIKTRHDLLIVDCRERDEHALVAMEGAVLIPLSELTERVVELTEFRERPIVIHCHLGGRSLHAARWLRDQGFAQAQSLAGGIDGWAIEIEPHLARY